MAESSPGARCEHCLGPVEQPAVGRHRRYCTPLCRRRAQRERDRSRREPGPHSGQWEPITDDLLLRVLRLHAGRREPLAYVLSLADASIRDIQCLVGVAVGNARGRHESWTQIGVAAGLSTAAARARWGGTQVPRLLATREAVTDEDAVRLPAQRRREPVTGPTPPAGRLAAALRTLLGSSRERLPAVASATGVPLSTITALLKGTTPPRAASWPEVYAVAHALGGSPGDLRHLWEHAVRATPPAGPSHDPARRLAAALRGALLAAGVRDSAPAGSVAGVPEAVGAVLAGGPLPAWPRLDAALREIGGDAAPLEQLWLAARSAETDQPRKETGP